MGSCSYGSQQTNHRDHTDSHQNSQRSELPASEHQQGEAERLWFDMLSSNSGSILVTTPDFHMTEPEMCAQPLHAEEVCS